MGAPAITQHTPTRYWQAFVALKPISDAIATQTVDFATQRDLRRFALQNFVGMGAERV